MRGLAQRSPRSSGDHQANELRARGVTGIALVFGVLAVVVSDRLHDKTLAADLFLATGEALVVAGILAFTVDQFFKRELVRDAFEAGFGYLLPTSMKPEVRWLVGQDLLCRNYDQHFKLTEHGDRLRLDVDLYRQVVNVGPTKRKYKPIVELDEWCEAVESDIEVLEVFRGNDLVDTLDNHPHRRKHNGVTVRATLPSIWLAPGEALCVHSRGHEIKARNGSYCQTVMTPVSSPIVYVDACDGIDARVSFGNRGECTQVEDRWLLPTTLLPHQVITVRWWEEQRARKLDNGSRNGRAGSRRRAQVG
jgi:hypothetical protein